MTTEGDSYQNPIRGIAEGVRDSRYWDSQALLEVFNNQKPGIVVRESAAITPRTFKCTKYNIRFFANCFIHTNITRMLSFWKIK